MKTVKLDYPIVIDGATVDTLSLHRPKARDMIAIGDHMQKIMSLQGDDEAMAEKMNSDLFKAMVAFVGTLSGIGEEAALEIDFADLTKIATEAAELMGEPGLSSGEAGTGA